MQLAHMHPAPANVSSSHKTTRAGGSSPGQRPAFGSRTDVSAWTGSILPLSPRADLDVWRAWTDLAAQTSAPLFLEPSFLALERPLLDGGEPLVIAARASGSGGHSLGGALPLVRRGRSLESLRSDHAPVFDYLGDPQALAAIWRTLSRDHSWDTLVLRGVPAGSPLTVRLPQLALPDLCLTALRPGSRSPYLPLPGFESRLTAKHRQNLRRCRRKLGLVELERVTDFSHAALEDAFAIEAMAWKGDAGTSIAGSRPLRHFYTALARLAARRGQLALSFLRLNGRRAAFALALEHQGTVHALKVGYDPALSDVSPGHLLFEELARDAERRGLLELDFMGQDDEWKRRWTHLTHDHVSLVIYRASPRGMATLIARELVKPRLPEAWLDLADRVNAEWTRRHRPCQRKDRVGTYLPGERALGQVRAGLGLRSGYGRIRTPPPAPSTHLGAPSRFSAGQLVRVRSRTELRATLDSLHRSRGLAFVPAQWSTSGRVYRVDRSVRRLVDDRGGLRPVSRTVLLEGASCDLGGDQLGCGRHCPLLFRDEWLEPVNGATADGKTTTEAATSSPDRSTPASALATWARVRPLNQIRATLDRAGRTDGVTFMPEMTRFAGARLSIVRQLTRVFEFDAWRPTRAPIYLLAGAQCTGAALGEEGPCDRACMLLWHGDWIEIEPTVAV